MDKSMLLSCSSEIKLFKYPDCDHINTYRPPAETRIIKDISWSKDGSLLSLVPSNGYAEIIRIKDDDMRPLQYILRNIESSAVRFQRTTKKNIAVGTPNGKLQIYDIKSRKVIKDLPKINSTVTMIDWNVNDTHLAVGSTDGNISLYNNTMKLKTSTFNVPGSKSVSTIRFHSTQKSFLGCASDEGAVMVWDITCGKKKFFMQSHKAPVNDVCFSYNNRDLLISVALDRTLQCYDIRTNKVPFIIYTDHPLSALDLHSNGYTVALGSIRGLICLYDLRNSEKPTKTIEAHSGEIKRVLFQPQMIDRGETLNLTEDQPVEVHSDGKKICGPSIDSISMFSFSSVNDYAAGDYGKPVFGTKDSLSDITLSFNSPHSDSRIKEKEIGNDVNMNEEGSIHNVPVNSITDHSESSKIKEHLSSNIILESLKQSSTPNSINPKSIISLRHEDMIDSVSPIISKTTVELDDIKKIMKDTVSEVVTQVARSCKNDTNAAVKDLINDSLKGLHEKIDDSMDSLKQNYRNLQWSLSALHVDQEDTMTQLLANIPCSSSPLIQELKQLRLENEFYKAKINELIKK